MRAAGDIAKGGTVKVDHIAAAGFVFDKTWDFYTYVGRAQARFQITSEDVAKNVSSDLQGEEREIAIADYLLAVLKARDLPDPPAPWARSPGLRVQIPVHPACPSELERAYPGCIVRANLKCTRGANESCPVNHRRVVSPDEVPVEEVEEPPVDPETLGRCGFCGAYTDSLTEVCAECEQDKPDRSGDA